jgi:glycine/D-amino acid oxidase-like deaminating enzyme
MKVGIIGGGIFGLSTALRYAKSGHFVDLFESQNNFCNLASRVNQARLHTGLHYPRDVLTAQTAHYSYTKFIMDFPKAVKKIEQFYAIAARDSLTSGDSFVSFADALGIVYEMTDPSELFNPGLIDVVLKVEEGSFDIDVLRDALLARIATEPRIVLHLGEPVKTITESNSSVVLNSLAGVAYEFDHAIVLCIRAEQCLCRTVGYLLA